MVSLVMERKNSANIDRGVFQKIAEVRLAYLFGSTARETKKTPADVDIAVLLASDVSAERSLDIRTDLMFMIMKMVGKNVDVVILNRANVVLRHQVVKHGKLLYEREKDLSCAYQVATLRDYEDYLPMQRYYMKVMDKRLGVDDDG